MRKHLAVFAAAIALILCVPVTWSKDSADEDDANEPDKDRMSGFCGAEFAYQGPEEERAAIIKALSAKPVFEKSRCKVLTSEGEIQKSLIFQRLYLVTSTAPSYTIVQCERPHRNLFKVMQNFALRFNKSSKLTYVMAATRCPPDCERSADCSDGYARCIRKGSDREACDERC